MLGSPISNNGTLKSGFVYLLHKFAHSNTPKTIYPIINVKSIPTSHFGYLVSTITPTPNAGITYPIYTASIYVLAPDSHTLITGSTPIYRT